MRNALENASGAASNFHGAHPHGIRFGDDTVLIVIERQKEVALFDDIIAIGVGQHQKISEEQQLPHLSALHCHRSAAKLHDPIVAGLRSPAALEVFKIAHLVVG